MVSRRDFIDGTAGVAAAAALPAEQPVALYDFAAIDAQLSRPARHRQVFAVAHVSDGIVFGMMRNSLVAYEETMREGPGVLHVAAVFYSSGVPLGLDDDVWHRYRLAEASARRGEPVRHGDGNPFLHDEKRSIGALVQRGASFFVCDNALGELAAYLSAVAGTTTADAASVRADLRRHLIPNALLVPAGVALLNAAQEARFTYAHGA